MEVVFTNDKLKDMKNIIIPDGSLYNIHLFSQDPPIRVLFCYSTNQDLDYYLSCIAESEKIIVLGLEWNRNLNQPTKTFIDIFQIATSKGVLVIQNRGPSKALKKFLTSNVFRMRGTENAKIKLKQYLGNSKFRIIDVESLYLSQSNQSTNFMSMISKYVGYSCLNIDQSDISSFVWNENINLQQLSYAVLKVETLLKVIQRNKSPIHFEPPQKKGPKSMEKDILELKKLIANQNQSIDKQNRIIFELKEIINQQNQTINKLNESVYQMKYELYKLNRRSEEEKGFEFYQNYYQPSPG